MIGKIKGFLVETDQNIGLIETSGGVFYNVFLPQELISLKTLPASVEVYTYLQVRDDALVLYGFKSKEHYQLFLQLLTVSGVGPKTAFNIISFSNTKNFISAIKDNDINFFTKIPGLGKKTSMKIILELSQKMNEKFSMEKMYLTDEDKLVVDALVSLGFKSPDAKRILQELPQKLSVEEKIKKALQISSTKK